MRLKLYMILSLLPFFCVAAKDYNIMSPDGKISMSVGESGNYNVVYNGARVFSGSSGLTLDGGKEAGTVSAPRYSSVDRTVKSPFYRSTDVAERYNSLSLKASDGWRIEFRVFNDGVAWRWHHTGNGPFRIVDEEVLYSFSDDCKVTVPYVRTDNIADFESQFFNSFENTYTESLLSEMDSRRLAFLPMVVRTPDNINVLLTESGVVSYPGLYLNRADGRELKGVFAGYPKKQQAGGYLGAQMLVTEREDFIARGEGKRSLPWRVAIISPDDKGLAQSTLGYVLGGESRLADTSWIKPGKVAWDWWNDWNLRGVDFVTGVNNDTYKAYIDFASRNGIEYVLLDDGWSSKDAGDLFTVVPEINLLELIAYGKEKGVGLILWAGYLPFAKDMEEVCRRYSDMGIKGFKVDFLDRNDQLMTDFEERAAETAAKYHLVLDLHGTHMPGGMNRRWPNVLNFEGVHGLEQMKFNRSGFDQLRYDCTIPFVRQASGPMDYTQGAMRNAVPGRHYISNSEPMSQGTRCHQLALYMVLDSPLNMLCDSPSNYDDERECTSFIAGVPTVWNETKVLDGEMGEYIVTARRSGDCWFVGGITDSNPRDLEIAFDFLPEGNFRAEIFGDGVNAHRAASDFRQRREAVCNTTVRKIHLAPGGGFAIKLTPESNR